MLREKLIKWDKNLAYCVGLLVSDGNLSKDGRHIVLVSKDKSLIKTFKNCLDLENRIANKKSGYNKNGRYYYVQFGNVKLYRWLNNIGVTQNKSKTIGKLSIPQKYFFDFTRGLLDGDGCVTSFNHPESRYPQIRVKFTSGSKNFIVWLRDRIDSFLDIKGKIEKIPRAFQLIYYKNDSIELLRRIYYKNAGICLNRKLVKTERLLAENKGGWWNWKTREA